ncbi:MAG: SMC-Scp complex subunit ScpB [Methylotenera sp.]|nr:SMC-Scp complex subunit ScpB [Methylotenera sp.]
MTTKPAQTIADVKQVLEAALLTANQPLSLDDMTRLFVERIERTSLRMLLDELKQDWTERSMELVPVASGYRFQARAEFAPFLARLNPERQLKYSRAVMETLAIIAYKQPVTRGDIEQIRGVTLNPTILRQLQERDWVDVVGQREVPGRPSLYATTKHFLNDFNILALSDLPAMADFAQQEIAFPADDEGLIQT